jgi:hypothetical protein
MIRIASLATAAAFLLGAVCATPAGATSKLQSEAKKQGLAAQNCQYCHVSKTPKKDTYKPEDLNERGKFLMAEKEKQGAKEIKVDWLKAYSGK